MCFLITNHHTDPTIESIEIAKSVAVIVCIDVFHHAAIKLIDLVDTQFPHHDCRFFTSYTTGTIGDNLFSREFLFVEVNVLIQFPEVDSTSRDSVFEMSEFILIGIPHIQYDVVIVIGIHDHFELIDTHSLSSLTNGICVIAFS
jgi:hypothetical protein